MALYVHRLSKYAILPFRASEGSAGYDLSSSEFTTIPACSFGLVSTDLAMIVPAGNYGRLAPRSGLASRKGIDVGGGVIDSDYRGHVRVLLFNHSDVDFVIQQGDRIAQIIIVNISVPDIIELDGKRFNEDRTGRGANGFGSTGYTSMHID